MLLAGGTGRQGRAGGVAAHGDDKVGGGQKLGGDRLEVDAGQADGKLDLIDAGHSTWEDASCAEIVTGWWKEGHVRA